MKETINSIGGILLGIAGIMIVIQVGDLKEQIIDIERENTLLKEQVVQLYDYVYGRNMEE